MDRRIHIDAEAVPHAPDLDVLLKRVVVGVFRQQPNVAFTVRYLVLAGGVIRHIRIRDVLDVPDHAVEDVRDLNVSVIIHRDDLGAWPVLSLVVRHLAHVLRQLVNSQAWPSVDRLTLHCASGRQHIRRPLPVVVRATSVELQIVDLVLTRLRQRPDSHVEPSPSGCQYAGVVFGRSAHSNCCGGDDACYVSHFSSSLAALRV